MLKIILKEDLYCHKQGDVAMVEDECKICTWYKPHYHIQPKQWIQLSSNSSQYMMCDFYSKDLFNIQSEVINE